MDTKDQVSPLADRRAHPRVQTEQFGLQGWIETDKGRVAVKVGDLSRGGALLVGDIDLDANAQVMVGIAGVIDRVPARVVSNAERGAGIEFVALDAGAQQQIDTAVFVYQRRRERGDHAA